MITIAMSTYCQKRKVHAIRQTSLQTFTDLSVIADSGPLQHNVVNQHPRGDVDCPPAGGYVQVFFPGMKWYGDISRFNPIKPTVGAHSAPLFYLRYGQRKALKLGMNIAQH